MSQATTRTASQILALSFAGLNAIEGIVKFQNSNTYESEFSRIPYGESSDEIRTEEQWLICWSEGVDDLFQKSL